MDPAPPPVVVVALVRDLMFSSKLTAAAKQSGVAVKIVRDAAKLAEVGGERLIVDLNAGGHAEAASAWKARTGGRVVGFVAHVAADAVAHARHLGLDRVVSNGGFAAGLPGLLVDG